MRLLAGGLAALVLTAAAPGYDYIRNSGTGLPVKWPDGTVPIRIMLGSSQTLSDGTNFSTSARGAAETWNALLGSVQFQSTIAAAGGAVDHNRVNELVFAGDIFGKAFGSTTLAVTTTWRIGNERTESDIIFNTGRTWDSFAGPTRSGVIDLHRVALHELGHSLGLDHPDEAMPPQTVSAIMNSRITSLDTLSMDDITGAQNLYGPPGPPENNSFAGATVMGNLSAAGSISLPGFNTLASKETGEPNHAGNAGGHSVWWKWTAPAAGSVTLDPRGSYYDTTLGVYTGTAVAALAAVASNDDINPGIVQASSLTFNATSGTVYFFAVDGFDGDTGGITLNLAFSSATATTPTITTQPDGMAAISGTNVQLSVVATANGTPITYQWRFNGTAISGATGATLNLTNVTAANAGSYTVVVLTSAGSVTSNAATVTVTAGAAPAFTTQPVSQAVTAGATVSISVTASGTPAPAITWSFNTAPFTGTVNVSTDPTTGNVTSIIQLANAQAANAGQYVATAANPVGTVTSNPVNLTVNPAPVVQPPPPSSGGGGGGAPSLWFLLCLGAAGLARLLRRR